MSTAFGGWPSLSTRGVCVRTLGGWPNVSIIAWFTPTAGRLRAAIVGRVRARAVGGVRAIAGGHVRTATARP